MDMREVVRVLMVMAGAGVGMSLLFMLMKKPLSLLMYGYLALFLLSGYVLLALPPLFFWLSIGLGAVLGLRIYVKGEVVFRGIGKGEHLPLLLVYLLSLVAGFLMR